MVAKPRQQVAPPSDLQPQIFGRLYGVCTPCDGLAGGLAGGLADGLADGRLGCTLAADMLREAGVHNVVSWSDQQLGPALTAAVCGKAFFSALRNSTATAPEVRIVLPTLTDYYPLSSQAHALLPPVCHD